MVFRHPRGPHWRPLLRPFLSDLLSVSMGGVVTGSGFPRDSFCWSGSGIAFWLRIAPPDWLSVLFLAYAHIRLLFHFVPASCSFFFMFCAGLGVATFCSCAFFCFPLISLFLAENLLIYSLFLACLIPRVLKGIPPFSFLCLTGGHQTRRSPLCPCGQMSVARPLISEGS